MKKKFLVALLGLAIIGGTLTACTEADKVSSNVSQEADNFNVLRRFAVINTRTDKVEFELVEGDRGLQAHQVVKITE